MADPKSSYTAILEQIEKMSKSEIGTCEICTKPVTVWDESGGEAGVVREGDIIFHGVCRGGKLAVAY